MKHNHIRRLCAASDVKSNPAPRMALTDSQRAQLLAKTAGTCHACGGRAGRAWQADHVIPYRLGGAHSVNNYLPICGECNKIRRSHSPAVLRLLMRLGTYARNEIRRETDLGEQLIRIYLRWQRSNRARRKGSVYSRCPTRR
jgi:5-methylcytosine-specific restriction endonuclease McrA